MSDPDAVVISRPLTWGDMSKFWPTYGDLAREGFTWGDLANATVEVMVRTAADALPSGTVTAADVRVIVGQVVRARYTLTQPAQTLRRDWRADAALVVAILSVVVAWLTYRQQVDADAHPDPPPSVTVIAPPPDAAEIERIVDERLREIGQHRQGEHPSSPTADSTADPEQVPPQR